MCQKCKKGAKFTFENFHLKEDKKAFFSKFSLVFINKWINNLYDQAQTTFNLGYIQVIETD